MGLFKGMKDMKDMLGATPGLLDQANQLSANAQVMQQQAAHQAAQQPAYGASPVALYTADLPAELADPIAGVDLATFAQVSAGLAAYDYDQSKAVVIAAERGIDAASWQLAMDGWNSRITGNPAVARQFNAFYTGARLMGMFSDYRSVMKTTKEMQRNTDVKGQMAGMQSKMEALNSSMTQTVTGRAMTDGVPATATITAAIQTGAMINFALAYQVDLLVMMPGGAPTPVRRTEVIPPLYLSRAMPGQVVGVRVMPTDPSDIHIDWAAA